MSHAAQRCVLRVLDSHLFWNHGYDHKPWDEGGKTQQEFKRTSYEFQKQHLDLSQRLAREKLGFPFRSFGAPFNATDANTARAIAAEPDLIQGHPTHRDDKGFAQFVQMVDFLTKAGAIFTTPSEYARLKQRVKHPEVK